MPNRRLYTGGQVPFVDAGWWNADGTAAIYLTTDPSLNQDALTLANRTTGAITIPAGGAQAYGGAPQGQGVLYLYFNGLLTTAEVDALSVGADGWTHVAHVDGATGLGYLALSPTAPVTLEPGDILSLPIAGVTATGSARAGNLTLVLSGVQGVPEGLDTLSIYVAVVAPPREGNRKLELLVGFAGPDFVFTGGQQNELLLVLTNPGTQPLVPGGTDAWGDEPPTFTFSFVFTDGSDAGALTTGTVAESMAVELAAEYGNFWDAVEKDEQAGPYPVWTAQPSVNGGGQVLGMGTKASVSFRISGIVSHQPAGATYLYVAYANVPGYDDGYFAVEIVKVAPVSASLYANPAGFSSASAPQHSTLHYTVNNATYAVITNTTFARSITEPSYTGTFDVTVATTTAFTLLASNHFTGQTAASSTTLTISPDPFSVLPIGSIVMWHGDINHPPPGWSVCNGSNNTPDLRDKFIMGAGNVAIGTPGGASTHVHGATAAVYVQSAGDHQHGVPSKWYSNTAKDGGDITVVDRHASSVSDAKTQTAGNHTHVATATVHVNDASSLPPYFALAFIMKTW